MIDDSVVVYLGQVEQNIDNIFDDLHVWQTAVTIVDEVIQHWDSVTLYHELTASRRQPC